MILNVFNIFLEFLLVGTFSFGGGYAMLGAIETTVVTNNQWITGLEFANMVGVSQVTPGPVSINLATYIGYKLGGIPTAILATVGMITTGFILVIIACKYIDKFRTNIYIEAIMQNLKPIIIALVISSFISLSDVYVDNMMSAALGTTAFMFLRKGKTSPIQIILLGALSGIIFFN